MGAWGEKIWDFLAKFSDFLQYLPPPTVGSNP